MLEETGNNFLKKSKTINKAMNVRMATLIGFMLNSSSIQMLDNLVG